jgi:hypothetical protein
VSAFLRSRKRAGYTAKCGPHSLDIVLGYLRGLDVVPAEAVVGPQTALERVLGRYADYLAQERALASSTIR